MLIEPTANYPRKNHLSDLWCAICDSAARHAEISDVANADTYVYSSGIDGRRIGVDWLKRTALVHRVARYAARDGRAFLLGLATEYLKVWGSEQQYLLSGPFGTSTAAAA